MQKTGTEGGLEQAYTKLLRRYHNVVARNMAGMYRTTLDGRILECNDALARMLGYKDTSELMEQPALKLYACKEERERFIEDLTREGKLINYEIRLRHRNGRAVYALENVHIEHWEGEPGTIEGTIIDVTAFRQAELEQSVLMQSYRSLVDHIRDGLMVVQNEKVVFANPAAEHLAGEDCTGKPLNELFTHDDVQRIHVMSKTMDNAQVQDPMMVSLGGKDLTLHLLPFVHEGLPAVQLTIQDEGAQRELMREQLRSRMAEEVNQVLREEIDRHRTTQEALRKSRRFARSLIDSSLDMILAADPEGHISEYNPAAAMRFGWEAEDVMGKESTMLYADPEEYERVQHELDTHGMFAGEIRNVSSTGEEFTSFLAASRLYDEDGAVLGVMGVSRDITQVKRDQEALRASEERYRDLFENATDLIQSVDHDGRFQYVNHAWYATLGYNAIEVEGLTLKDIIHPDHRTRSLGQFEAVLKGGDTGIIRTVFVAKDGREITVEGSTNLHRQKGRSPAARSIFRDITHEETARRKVQQHEAKMRALFESSDHLFWTVDPDVKLTSYNHGYAAMIKRLYGVDPEINTDPKRPRKHFADESYHAFWEAKYKEAFTGRTMRFETERTDVDGERVCNEIFLSPVFGPDGQVIEVFGVGHEITEQKEAEDTVRDQAARLQAIFDSSANMMIWTLDKELMITSCNAHFRMSVERDFGLQVKIGDPFVVNALRRATGKQFNTLLGRYHDALKGKPQQFEAELIDRNGRSIWVESFISPIVVDGSVQELSCLTYEITDRKQAQIELLASLHEKEVLLKEVHHRVKNNLQIVSSIFSLQTAHVGEDKRILDLLRDSRDRIRSMSFIHESLYQNKDFSSIDLADYMEGLSRNLMMSYSLTGKVRLVTDLQRIDLALDQAIPCGLILNELISNALKHAFPGGREGTIEMGLELMGNTVSISLRDDGKGAPPGFDPQRDANLGLELVHTLVEQLDGRLSMQTDAGVAYLLTFERIK